ncbi:SMP-30/gluconolactonase/LRE family protein [Chloroflexota bacterium]
MAYKTEILLDGLVFGEGPRWHEGKLWFSDIYGRKVMTVDLNGKAETIVDVPTLPSGLGWLPDGRLLIVSMAGRRLLRLDPDGLSVAADLSKLAVTCNDMVVDNQGRAYIGSYAYDVVTYKPGAPAWIILVTTDGDIHVVASEMESPNGMVITPDGHTLIVADTFAEQLIAFNIDSDGCLTGRHIWAQLGAGPDGICLDAEGAIWVALPHTAEVLRCHKGGDVTHRIKVSTSAYACMLGGPDRRTLFIMTAESFNPEETRNKRSARIEIVDVDIPGAGLP